MLPEAAIEHDHIQYGPPVAIGPERATENVRNPVALAALRTVITRKLHTDTLRVCKGNPFLRVINAEEDRIINN